MKNKIYLIGLASLMIVSAGCIFKNMHWPFANILLVLGIVSLSLVFIPAALISSFRAEENKRLKALYIMTAVILSLDLVGILFKIMHWPGAGILLFCSIPLMFLILLPVSILRYRKEEKINYRNFMALIFFFAYYAAVSALLSLSVTKDIINGFVISAENIDQETSVLIKQSQMKSAQKENLDFTKDINANANKICSKIDNIIKLQLKEQADKNPKIYSKDGRPNLWEIQYKDNWMSDMILNDLSDLKADIDAYKKLIGTIQNKKDATFNMNSLVCTEVNDDGRWEYNMIKDKIIVSGIEQLYLLKHQIRFMQVEAISLIEN